MPLADRILVVPLGGPSEPTQDAIRAHDPGHVCFLCFRPGPDSAHKNNVRPDDAHEGNTRDGDLIQEVVSRTGLKHYDVIPLPSLDGIKACVFAVSDLLGRLRCEFPEAEITVDIAGGARSVSLALVIAALHHRVPVAALAGCRTSPDPASPGSTQYLRTYEPALRLQHHLDSLNQYWRECRFLQCEKQAREMATETAGADTLAPLFRAYADIARAFYNWDHFDHAAALEGLEPLGPWFESRREFLRHTMEALGRLANLRFPGVGTRPIPKRRFAPVHDLLLNAGRRLEQHQFDDAVSRTYRSLEMLAQLQLAYRDPPIDTANLDPALLPQQFIDEQVASPRDGPLQVGLFRAFRLLVCFNDPVGRAAGPSMNQLLAQIELRHQSFLAHGTSRVEGDQARGFFEFACEFLSRAEAILEIPEAHGWSKAPPFPLLPFEAVVAALGAAEGVIGNQPLDTASELQVSLSTDANADPAQGSSSEKPEKKDPGGVQSNRGKTRTSAGSRSRRKR